MTQEDRERLVRIETILKANNKSFSILFKSIEGNGQPGLKQRITLLEAEHVVRQKISDTAPTRQGNVIQWLMLAVALACCAITVIN